MDEFSQKLVRLPFLGCQLLKWVNTSVQPTAQCCSAGQVWWQFVCGRPRIKGTNVLPTLYILRVDSFASPSLVVGHQRTKTLLCKTASQCWASLVAIPQWVAEKNWDKVLRPSGSAPNWSLREGINSMNTHTRQAYICACIQYNVRIISRCTCT